jgi:DNA-binding response OmpR family regulator
MEEFVAVAARLLQKAEQARSKLDKAVREAVEIIKGSLTLKIPESRALVNGKDAELTPKEFAVLLVLVSSEGKEVSGEEIYRNVWGADMNNDSTAVRNHIYRLKKKLGEENTDSFSIVNLYGGGYAFTTK